MDNTRSVPVSQRTSVQRVVVDAARDGQRLDNFLLYLLKSVPRSVVYRLCRKGEVRVNGGRVKPSRRLVQGDEVRIPPVTLESSAQRRVPDSVVHTLETAVVFEDDDIIVLNKPPGIAVHGGSGHAFGVIEAMRQSRGNSTSSLDLVHRLDRDTSGCLLLAKHAAANRDLKQLLASRHVEKHYSAIVLGRWPRDVNRIENALLKNRLRSGERVTTVDIGGRNAVTDILAIEWGKQCSLLGMRIETGRTHQIRVHTAGSGHPVLGDRKYGDFAFNRQFHGAGHTGMHLHSTELAFSWRGERLFRVPPPSSWDAALKL